MITLYDYQKKALKKIKNAFKLKMRVLTVMASGLGKTILAAFWAKTEIIKGGRGLFLCHENFILEQSMKEFRKVLGQTASLGVFHGQEKILDEVDVLFASFQTFKNWKKAFFENEFDFIIVDESHHGQATTYKKVIDYFRPKCLLGITATPNRMDQKDIRDIFGEEVVHLSLEQGIANGWLAKVEYRIITDNLNTRALQKIAREVLEKGKRISIKQLNETIFIKARDEEVAKIITSYNKKTIIFCESIMHAENFQKYIPNSATYHSHKTVKENQKALKSFKKGKMQYLLAINKFNEGVDIPDAVEVVFLRCTDSETIFFQQLGRGLRKIPGKEKVIVLDFVANCDRVAAIKAMAEKITELSKNKIKLEKTPLYLSGKFFNFIFQDEQIDMLEIIQKIKSRPQIWEEMFECLLEFKETHGHCNVPQEYLKNPQLGRWCGTQRKFRKKGELSSKREKRLAKIGFIWDSYDTFWEEMFKCLLEFKEIQGHCNVPQKYPKNPQFGRWCCNQRGFCKKGELSPEREKRLTEIGFIWNSHDAFWEEMFKCLLKFKKTYGHCNISKKYLKNPQLGSWCGNQREFCKKGELSSEREKRLTEIGFIWNAHNAFWEEMFKCLLEFKEIQGHCNVPSNYPKNLQLGRWCYTQRGLYKKGELSSEREKRLTEIGFIWNAHNAFWEEMFKCLLEFKEIQGHCNVPSNYPKNLQLGTWCRNQRKFRKKNELSSERKKRLTEIGFA